MTGNPPHPPAAATPATSSPSVTSPNRRRLLGLTAGAGAALTGALVGSPVATAAHGGPDADPIVGVWVVTRGTRDTLYAFIPGGILQVVGTPVITLPPALGGDLAYDPGSLGVWRQVAAGHYVATSVANLYNDRQQGQLRERDQLEITLDEDGTGFALSVAFELSRWDGEVLDRGRGQGHASRLTA